MKRNARRKQWNKVGVLLFVMALLTGCGKTPGPGEAGHYTYYPQEKQEDNTEFVFEGTEDEVYALLSIDYVEEMIHVYRYANGLEYQYYYGMQTNFLDKYGNVTAATNFAPGSLVELGRTDSQGLLQEVRAADSVWVYPDVVRFSVDETKHIFDIAGTEYKYDASIFVFSDDEQIKITDLAEQDKLTVIGKDKQILSIQVTTGHGALELLNTALFEGSFVQLDTDYFAIITSNMKMEIPEGTYTLSVANDGWGGTVEIEIKRGESTVVDLDEIKGDGPQYGDIVFTVNVEDAKILVDNERVYPDSPICLKYGWHTLSVTASQYDSWNKKLYVNSPEATVSIELEGGSGTNSPDTESTETGEGVADESGTTDSGSSSGGNNTNLRDNSSGNTTSNNENDKYLEDYLSTLTELIGGL